MRPSLPGVDTTLIANVIRDVLRTDPPKSLPNMTVDTLTVNDALTLKGAVDDQTSPWHYIGHGGEPAFANSWVNFDGPGGRHARFRKLPNGFVVLSGIISGGTIGAPAFTLPPGYRIPSNYNSTWFPVVSNAAFGAVNVSADGNIQPQVGSNVWLFLDGVMFDTNL